MPHSGELIKMIRDKLIETYPEDQFTYVIERALVNQKKRMLPDIQVLDQRQKIVCAVEIGYTRPEKLRHYRALGIPDVRWYDKKGKHVHDQWVNSVRVEKPSHLLNWYTVELNSLCGTIMCHKCFYDNLGDDRDDVSDEEMVTAEKESMLIDDIHVYTDLTRLLLVTYCEECDWIVHTMKTNPDIHNVQQILMNINVESLDDLRALCYGKHSSVSYNMSNFDHLGGVVYSDMYHVKEQLHLRKEE